MSELKPCPLCSAPMRWNTGRQLIIHVNQNPECPLGDLGFPEHRLAAWNTRPQPSAEPVDDLIEREPIEDYLRRKAKWVEPEFDIVERHRLLEAADHIAALEADNARLMGLVKEAGEGFSGPAAWLERWATHVGNCHGGALCECGLTLASLESATTLAKIKEPTDGRVTD